MEERVSEQAVEIDRSNRATHVRRGQRLEYFTIAYNSLEGVLSVLLGFLAGSIALVGFVFDSVIEVISGAALLWHLGADDEARRERAEATALGIVGWCFLALAAYVTYDSVASLIRREAPEESIPGIVLAALSLAIMPVLARAKRRVAAEIRSGALKADAKQTELCTYLSALLLGGLALNATLGWWWADRVAALAMVSIIAKEGVEALRGKRCCDDDGCH